MKSASSSYTATLATADQQTSEIRHGGEGRKAAVVVITTGISSRAKCPFGGQNALPKGSFSSRAL